MQLFLPYCSFFRLLSSFKHFNVSKMGCDEHVAVANSCFCGADFLISTTPCTKFSPSVIRLTSWSTTSKEFLHKCTYKEWALFFQPGLNTRQMSRHIGCTIKAVLESAYISLTRIPFNIQTLSGGVSGQLYNPTKSQCVNILKTAGKLFCCADICCLIQSKFVKITVYA